MAVDSDPSLLLFLAVASLMSLGGSDGKLNLWCVAKNNAEDVTLQTALDWACGQGGAECGPIQQGGACYDSGDVQKMATYAFNDYYLKHPFSDDTCYFHNNAALTSLDPIDEKCKFPSSVAVYNESLSESPTVNDSMNLSSSGGGMMHIGWFLPVVLVICCSLSCDHTRY